MCIFNHYIGNRFLRILLIALLILCMVFGGCMVQYSYADLVLLPAVAICATILIACGVVASSDPDLQSVATSFYRSLDVATIADVNSIATAYTSAGADKFVFKATKSILSAVGSWFASQDYTGFEQIGNTFLCGYNVAGLTNASIQGVDLSAYYYPNVGTKKFFTYPYWDIATAALFGVVADATKLPFVGKTFYQSFVGSGGTYARGFAEGSTCVIYRVHDDGSLGGKLYEIESGMHMGLIFNDNKDGMYYGLMYAYAFCFGGSMFYLPLDYGDAKGDVTTFPATNVKSDSTYFPREVVDAAGSTTTFPTNVASKPLTTETPLTIPQTGVNSGTGVGDVRTDAPATDIPTTEVGWLEKVWDGVMAIPTAIAGGVTAVVDAVGNIAGSIADTLADFFNPAGFKLDFSKFKIGLTEVFPFCIPFDFLKGIKSLASDSAGYSFTIKLTTDYFKINHTVDLSPFRVPILFFRFICDFWFGYILISRTRDWIKW